MNTMKLAVPLFVALAFGPSQGWAKSVMGSELSKFAVLGSTTVTNVPASNVTGDVGVWSSGGANAISGFNSSPVGAVSDLQVTGGKVFAGLERAKFAQGELTGAITFLGGMGTGTTLGSDLTGLKLTPGVYTVTAGASNLMGKLTLDGGGNANAAWVFQMESSLVTSSGSTVDLINTGSDAGVFWDVRSSATLGSGTAFIGNILALSSVTLDTGASMGCGGAYANTGAVTMNMNAISFGCGGGLEVKDGSAIFLNSSVSAVPEPETYGMMLAGLGVLGFTARRKKKQA